MVPRSMLPDDYEVTVKDKRRTSCVVLDSEGDEGAAGRSANTWSLSMGQLLGVDVEILDAAERRERWGC